MGEGGIRQTPVGTAYVVIGPYGGPPEAPHRVGHKAKALF